MRVSFLNTYEDRGGAARAAVRLFEGVRALPDVDARLLVRERGHGRPGVQRLPGLPTSLSSRLDQCALKAAHPQRERKPYSVNRVPGPAAWLLRRSRPDVAHLHWLHCGLLRIESLARLNVPVVWTIHDMWAFTGVCHYAGDCGRWRTGCGQCPALGSADPRDVSARTFARKAAAWPRLNPVVAAPSRWLADLAGQSPLLGGRRIEVIPNGLDTGLYAPLPGLDKGRDADRRAARGILGLPPLPADARPRAVVLLGADHALKDPRKGGAALLRALAETRPHADVVVFGHDGPLPKTDGLRLHGVGVVRDEAELARIYAAADLYVLPSLEDNLPNTVLEALACGTPVLAFRAGGVPEMVTHGQDGLLVSGSGPVPMAALAATLRDALRQPDRLREMGARARETAVREYDVRIAARRYRSLYRSLAG